MEPVTPITLGWILVRLAWMAMGAGALGVGLLLWLEGQRAGAMPAPRPRGADRRRQDTERMLHIRDLGDLRDVREAGF